MKVTLSYGLKLPLPGVQFSNKEAHATVEVEVKTLDETLPLRQQLRTLVESEVKLLGSKKTTTQDESSW